MGTLCAFVAVMVFLAFPATGLTRVIQQTPKPTLLYFNILEDLLRARFSEMVKYKLLVFVLVQNGKVQRAQTRIYEKSVGPEPKVP